ncbi:hypothetical protein CTAYLR_003487 [Chrysophaeum taylorii]|uniref:Amidohydrolase 3 domain-containing protein n=1 Tax=Chrysophaeum taylorii TaxID=2483200 RepID=A0AAD7XL70_9STRA|nr:hypothetical protein CTAYLR_003487 [Chrysophaeum taylorii]
MFNNNSSSLAVAAAAAAVTSVAWWWWKNTTSTTKLRVALWWGRGSVILEDVRCPAAVLPKGSAASPEGLVACNVHIHNGTIAAVLLQDADTSLPRVACGAAVCVPCFADAHAHLVKTQVVPRNRNSTGSMTGALAAEVCDRPRWTLEDISRRMEFGLKCAFHHGSKAARTHLDGCSTPEIADAVYAAFDAARDKFGALGMTVQGVANLYLPLWLEPEIADPHVKRALASENVVLGAYCGNVSYSPEVVRAMDALFAYAANHLSDVDLHIDESNDPDCCALLALCESLEKARATGYRGRVVLGHACALALQNDETKAKICASLARLQDVYVVANPFTNLALQDRRGTARPLGLPVAADAPRTPFWRGITLLQELKAAGVEVAAASDNVRDHWYPYGDYDMLAVWANAVILGHLDTAPNEGSWADLVTDTPSRAMGLVDDFSFSVGSPADLVLFPNARRLSELFARPHLDRLVLRRGRLQNTQLPPFSDLDDLVALASPAPDPDLLVLRGATVLLQEEEEEDDNK